MHARKRVEIVVESALTEKVIDIIDRAQAPGYTVVEAVSGRGSGGPWKRDQLTNAFHRHVIVVVADAAVCQEIVNGLRGVINTYEVVLFVSDVEVLRPEHF